VWHGNRHALRGLHLEARRRTGMVLRFLDVITAALVRKPREQMLGALKHKIPSKVGQAQNIGLQTTAALGHAAWEFKKRASAEGLSLR
jgi:hypothetical protein